MKSNKKASLIQDYLNGAEEEEIKQEEVKEVKEVKEVVKAKAKTKAPKTSEKPKGRKPGAQAFEVRKTAPNYKIVTIRYKEDEYNEMYSQVIKKYGSKYSSLSNFIKEVINEKLK